MGRNGFHIQCLLLFLGFLWTFTGLSGQAFEASCLNITLGESNSQLYLELDAGNFGNEAGMAKLEVSFTVRKPRGGPVRIDKVFPEMPYFGPNLEIPEAILNYPFQVEPGPYRIEIEVRDLISRKRFYRDIDYVCQATENPYRWSDILLLRNSDQFPMEAITAQIGELLPSGTSKLRLYAEAYTENPRPLTANAVLFHREPQSGGFAYSRFTSLAQINQVLQPEGGRAQLSLPFELDSLSSGEYLLELYLYADGELVATQNRKFILQWEGLGEVLGNLNEAIGQMVYVCDSTRIKELLALPETEKARSFLNFWRDRNGPESPVPTAAMERYYERIALAKREFQEDRPGWLTDRGRIFFHYGPPDTKREINYRNRNLEVWWYEQWGLKFVFILEQDRKLLLNPGNISQL